MHNNDTDLLADLIRRKRECLVQLALLGRKQWDFINQDQMTGLLEVLAAKQRALADLQQIEKGLEPFRGQSPDERTWPTAEARRQSAEMLSHCEMLLREIVAQERRCEEELVRRRDAVGEQLDSINQASIARGAYLGEMTVDYGRLDLSSGT